MSKSRVVIDSGGNVVGSPIDDWVTIRGRDGSVITCRRSGVDAIKRRTAKTSARPVEGVSIHLESEQTRPEWKEPDKNRVRQESEEHDKERVRKEQSNKASREELASYSFTNAVAWIVLIVAVAVMIVLSVH